MPFEISGSLTGESERKWREFKEMKVGEKG